MGREIVKRIYQHPQDKATGASAVVFKDEALAPGAAAGDEGIAGSAGSNRLLRKESSVSSQSSAKICSVLTEVRGCCSSSSIALTSSSALVGTGSDGRLEANERTLESLFNIHTFTCDISAFCKAGDMEISILKEAGANGGNAQLHFEEVLKSNILIYVVCTSSY